MDSDRCRPISRDRRACPPLRTAIVTTMLVLVLVPACYKIVCIVPYTALTCYKVPDSADLKNVFAAVAAVCTDSLATFGARFQARLCELEILRVHLRRLYLPHLVPASATHLCVLSYVSFMIYVLAMLDARFSHGSMTLRYHNPTGCGCCNWCFSLVNNVVVISRRCAGSNYNVDFSRFVTPDPLKCPLSYWRPTPVMNRRAGENAAS